MKTFLHRLMIAAGCLLLLAGIFFDEMPVELLMQFQTPSSSHPYLLLAPSNGGMDTLQLVCLVIGTLLLIAGLLIRRHQSKR